jgi:hypothetical protein
MSNLSKPRRASPPEPAHKAPAPGRSWWLSQVDRSQSLTVHLQRLSHRWRSLGRLQRWVAVCAVAGLAVLAVTYVAISSNSHQALSPTSDGTSRAVSNADPAIKSFTPAHKSSSSDTPESDVAAIRVPRALANALKRWDAGPGGAAFAQVSGDLAAATQSSGIHLLGPLLQACSSLASAVTTAKSGPPIPDTGMQGLYSRALAKLAAGAAECRAGLSQYPTEDQGLQTRENSAVVHKADLELAVGAKYLYNATVDINAVHEHARG